MNTKKYTEIPCLVFIGSDNEVRDDLGPAKMYSEHLVLVPKICGYVEGKMDGTVSAGSYVKRWMPLVDWPPGETAKGPEPTIITLVPMWVYIVLPSLLAATLFLTIKLYNITH